MGLLIYGAGAWAVEPVLNLEVNVRAIHGVGVQQQEMYLRAIDLLKKVVNSTEFYSQVLEFEYQGKKQFAQNNGMSNQQILEKIQLAVEGNEIGSLGVIDLETDVYWSRRVIPRRKLGTVGYTSFAGTTIFTNGYQLRIMDEAELAGHLFHEWTHQLGFEHDFNNTLRRPYSVPYALGEIIEDLAKSALAD